MSVIGYISARLPVLPDGERAQARDPQRGLFRAATPQTEWMDDDERLWRVEGKKRQ